MSGFSGKVAIGEMVDRLGLQIDDGGFETVGGYVLTRVGRVPAVGERFAVDGLDIEILEAERRRIHKVRLRKIPTPAAHTARCSGVSALPNTPGTSAAVAMTNATPTTITNGGRSRSVSATSAAPLTTRDPTSSLNTADSAPHIVGRPATTVRIPAVATAPAPMYRT